MDALRTPRRRCATALLTGLLLGAAQAQHPVIQRFERAFADGLNAPVERALDSLLRSPGGSAELRFEAWMLHAECAYRAMNMVRFVACTDSAAALIAPTDHARQTRVELNRCRHAAVLIHTHRAHRHAMAALRQFRQVPDRDRWRYAYFVHQTVGTMYRNWPVPVDTAFAHFDTAQALLARRRDVLPYWHAHLHKAIANAAMDRIRPGSPEQARCAPLCDRAQLASLAILERHHPGQVAERALMENLRGLYHIYGERPDSAWRWLRRAEARLAQSGLPDELLAMWLTSLRWQAFLTDLPPWWDDAAFLQAFHEKLLSAQERMADYTALRITAGGLFHHDPYSYTPYPAAITLSLRLWQLTGDTVHVDRMLWAAEKARRDAWNIAQELRGRPGSRLPDPPERMLRAVQERLGPGEAMLLYVQDGRSGREARNEVLAITREAFAAEFIASELDAMQGGVIAYPDAASYRRSYHTLYQQLYAPVAHLLQEAHRVRVFPSGEMAHIAFDALLADNTGADLAACQPLLQRHAFSYPLLLLPPAPQESGGPSHFLAPAPGSGALTDLKRLRMAMRRWAGDAAVDSSGQWMHLAPGMTTADVLYLAGHGDGVVRLDMEPRHYFGADTVGRTGWMYPSDLMPLDLQARLVVHLACQSGFFETDPSSGAFSFARAFLFAGARSVLSTAVLTDEGAAIRLVDLLREELADGHPTDVALQRAKLAYLERYTLQQEQLPMHWAGWQLHGEPRALIPPPPSPWPWVLAGALLLAGLAVVWAWGRG